MEVTPPSGPPPGSPAARSGIPTPAEADVAITVQLHLGLARFHPHLETGRAVPVKVPPGSTVEWVVGRTCGLDTAIRPLVTVNGQPSSLAEQVHEGDRVRLFLPLSGG